jgi:hypothetical protein
MDSNREQPLLGNGYNLDLVNNLDWIVPCRDDGTEVAKFSLCDERGNRAGSAGGPEREPAGVEFAGRVAGRCHRRKAALSLAKLA